MFAPTDPADRTECQAGEIVQCDLWFPAKIVPVGPGVMAAPPGLTMVTAWSVYQAGIGQHHKLTVGARGFAGTLGTRIYQTRPRDPEAKGVVERANGYLQTRSVTAQGSVTVVAVASMADTRAARRAAEKAARERLAGPLISTAGELGVAVAQQRAAAEQVTAAEERAREHLRSAQREADRMVSDARAEVSSADDGYRQAHEDALAAS